VSDDNRMFRRSFIDVSPHLHAEIERVRLPRAQRMALYETLNPAILQLLVDSKADRYTGASVLCSCLITVLLDLPDEAQRPFFRSMVAQMMDALGYETGQRTVKNIE
jgi:hypothetical protein